MFRSPSRFISSKSWLATSVLLMALSSDGPVASAHEVSSPNRIRGESNPAGRSTGHLVVAANRGFRRRSGKRRVAQKPLHASVCGSRASANSLQTDTVRTVNASMKILKATPSFRIRGLGRGPELSPNVGGVARFQSH